MNIFRYLVSVLAGLALAALAGCGGGGGGGGGGLPALVYTGNSSAATATNTNASRLTANVVGSDDAATIIAGISAEGGGSAPSQVNGVANLSRRLGRDFRDIAGRARSGDTAQQVIQGALQPVNFTTFCDGNVGSISISGTIDDVTGLGTLNVGFNSCLIGSVTLNGQGTMRIDAFDVPNLIATDFTMSFGRLTLRAVGLSLDAGGTVRVLTDIFTKTETVFADLVHLDNNAGRMTKTENLVITNVYSPSVQTPISFTSSINGRVYDSVHGFVNVTTLIPLNFANATQQFPDGGRMRLTDGGGRTIVVIPVNSTLVNLELDLDGVPGVDHTATLKWTDLTDPVGADVGDADSDGMHNSWEDVNFFLRGDPADAAFDTDGDGRTNLMEYAGGSDPRDFSSLPSPIDLGLAMSDSFDPIVVNHLLTYTIVVGNFSSIAASNVVVTDTLPAGVNFVSATPSQGSCSGTTPLTCNLGTIGGFVNANIVIQVTPTAAGLISNTASVTSSTSFDPNLANNSATENTTVN